MINILMIEDDAELAQIITEYLDQFDIKVTNVEEPFMGSSLAVQEDFDLLILDLTLPGLDGLDICKDIRKESDIPIIISTARSDMEDKITAFEYGADDYLPKPYDPQELLLRIKTVLKRTNKEPNENKPIKNSVFKLNEKKHEIKFHGKVLTLTEAEYEILAYLIEKNGDIVSRTEMMYSIDSISDHSSKKSIDVIIGRIRNKIGDDPKNAKYIISVRGLGYRINEDI